MKSLMMLKLNWRKNSMKKVLILSLFALVILLTGCAQTKVVLKVLESNELTETRLDSFSDYLDYKDELDFEYQSNFFGNRFLYIYVVTVGDSSPSFTILDSVYDEGIYTLNVGMTTDDPGLNMTYALIFEIPKYPHVDTININIV